MRPLAGVALGTFCARRGLADVLTKHGSVALVVADDDAVAAEAPALWALDALEMALVANGARTRRVRRLAGASAMISDVTAATRSSLAQTLLRQWHIVAAAEAESLCLAQGQVGPGTVLLAAGNDSRGLVYALTELADRVHCHRAAESALFFSTYVY